MIVTVPAAVVAPASIVSTGSGLRVKPGAGSCRSVAAATVTRSVSVVRWSSCAVTAAVPPLSPMSSGSRCRVRIGNASSSAMVNCTGAGAMMPWSLRAVPDIRTILSGWSTSSSAAVTVTAPVLDVVPARMVSSRCSLRLKSPSAAPVSALTVTVVCSLDGRSSCAVTATVPPRSAMVSRDSSSVTSGVGSSSSMVSVRGSGGDRAAPLTAPVTRTCRAGASALLSTTAMRTLPVLALALAAMVRVAPSWVKEGVVAGASGAAVTVIVTSRSTALDSSAVTRVAPSGSAIAVSDRFSITVSFGSSSRMVRVPAAGAARKPSAAAVTEIRLSGAYTSLSRALMVSEPLLAPAPEANVSVVPLSV